MFDFDFPNNISNDFNEWVKELKNIINKYLNENPAPDVDTIRICLDISAQKIIYPYKKTPPKETPSEKLDFEKLDSKAQRKNIGKDDFKDRLYALVTKEALSSQIILGDSLENVEDKLAKEDFDVVYPLEPKELEEHLKIEDREDEYFKECSLFLLTREHSLRRLVVTYRNIKIPSVLVNSEHDQKYKGRAKEVIKKFF